MLIYLRHGNDHSSDNEHRHDRHLSGKGRRKASKVAKRLIEKFGHPAIAYVSPFRRTTETLEAMTEHFTRPVAVIHDVRLAQYFTPKMRRTLDIGESLAGILSIGEDKAAFRARVDQHIDDMKIANHHLSEVVVWCITHTVVLEHVSSHFDERLPDPVEFLDRFVIDRSS